MERHDWWSISGDPISIRLGEVIARTIRLLRMVFICSNTPDSVFHSGNNEPMWITVIPEKITVHYRSLRYNRREWMRTWISKIGNVQYDSLRSHHREL